MSSEFDSDVENLSYFEEDFGDEKDKFYSDNQDYVYNTKGHLNQNNSISRNWSSDQRPNSISHIPITRKRSNADVGIVHNSQPNIQRRYSKDDTNQFQKGRKVNIIQKLIYLFNTHSKEFTCRVGDFKQFCHENGDLHESLDVVLSCYAIGRTFKHPVRGFAIEYYKNPQDYENSVIKSQNVLFNDLILILNEKEKGVHRLEFNMILKNFWNLAHNIKFRARPRKVSK